MSASSGKSCRASNRSPARFLIAHRDAAHGQSVPGGQLQHARRQFPRGQSAKMAFDGRMQIGDQIREPDGLAAKADGISFAVEPGFNADRVAAQKNLRSNRPGRRFPGLCWSRLSSRPARRHGVRQTVGPRCRAAAGNRDAGECHRDASGADSGGRADCTPSGAATVAAHRQVDNREAGGVQGPKIRSNSMA